MIEVVSARAKCKDCGNVFDVKKHNAVCPKCSGKELELLSGREFYIKEIAVFD